ncbi:MAG: glycogen debranching enzyme family protein [Candidatus Melainabacteria bacterium]|nr:glycogen debranching enzyme family protein [Candidatus Melainabacteria bacterium]
MTFGLTGWLKSRHRQIDYEIPVWFPTRNQPDNREWIITNGLGGYASGTISTINRRKYHAAMVSSLVPPVGRQVVLSRIEEIVTINGNDYDLASNTWASGVISPMGYKHIECFTMLPSPTWVYQLDGNYLIKRMVMTHGQDRVTVGYTFIPNPDSGKRAPHAQINIRFLVGCRNHHMEVKGAAKASYPQLVSPHQSLIILNEEKNRLCLSWPKGQYQAEKQWWWDYAWAEETARGEPDTEDLYLVGSLSHALKSDEEYSIAASFETPHQDPDCQSEVNAVVERQLGLIRKASLPRSQGVDALILAADTFIVNDAFEKATEHPMRRSVIEGYPWFNDSGRSALFGLVGLTLTVRRFDEARAILRAFAARRADGMVANRTIEPKWPLNAFTEPGLEFNSLDVTLAYALALHNFYRLTKDKDFTREHLPVLMDTFAMIASNQHDGVKLDEADGLVVCGLPDQEYTWNDSRIAEIPITPRAGKPVEINALWFNFLKTILHLAAETGWQHKSLDVVQKQLATTSEGIKRFWNEEKQCLYDGIDSHVLGIAGKHGRIETVRANQIVAVSLPFRAFDKTQEAAILKKIEEEILTPYGLRSLSIRDPEYQSKYGCGFEHADQYHRDLSYHQGCVWTWLIGPYLDALLHVQGSGGETQQKAKTLLQPLMAHLLEDGLLGGISEIFDGTAPHIARGCPSSALAVAEVMRWQGWLLRQ